MIDKIIKCLQRASPYVSSFGKCSLSLEIEEIITLLKEEKEKDVYYRPNQRATLSRT